MADENAAGSVTPDPAAAAAATGAKPAETTAEPEKVEGAEPEGDKSEGSDAAEADKASEAAKALAARKQTAKERINELTRQSRDNERRAQRAEADAAALRAKLKEPDPATYEDIGKLTAAQIDHTLDRREVSRKTDEAAEANREADAIVAEAWNERVSLFKEQAVDFDEVALKAPISDAAARDIARMEEGPQVAYYLGKHPAEARALNNLSERDRAVQLGRLAGRLTQAPPRRTSTAPTPVDAVAGKGAQTSRFNPETASMDEFAAKRAAGWKG